MHDAWSERKKVLSIRILLFGVCQTARHNLNESAYEIIWVQVDLARFYSHVILLTGTVWSEVGTLAILNAVRRCLCLDLLRVPIINIIKECSALSAWIFMFRWPVCSTTSIISRPPLVSNLHSSIHAVMLTACQSHASPLAHSIQLLRIPTRNHGLSIY